MRLPVSALFENLGNGAQLQDFVAWFPGVTTEQALPDIASSLDLLMAGAYTEVCIREKRWADTSVRECATGRYFGGLGTAQRLLERRLAVFAGLAVVLAWNRRDLGWLYLFGLLAGLAAVLELMQSFVDGRRPHLQDVSVDLAAVGFVMWAIRGASLRLQALS
jgi:hypothetical protein